MDHLMPIAVYRPVVLFHFHQAITLLQEGSVSILTFVYSQSSELFSVTIIMVLKPSHALLES